MLTEPQSWSSARRPMSRKCRSRFPHRGGAEGSDNRPGPPTAAPLIAGATGGLTTLIRSPLVRRMLDLVLAEPIFLSPDERYLHGHYLAYLLSGSRRRGLFLHGQWNLATPIAPGCCWA